MPSTVDLKDLYYAKSIEDLFKKAEIKDKEELKKRPLQGLVNIASKIIAQAKENIRKGDEELAFVYYYRFFTVESFVKNEDKMEFTKKLNYTKEAIMGLMTHLEKLQERLSKRYDNQKKNYEERKAMVFPNSTPSFPGTSVKVDTNESNNTDNDEDNDDVYPTVDAKELVKFICQTSSTINKVLIIDIRPSKDFEESSITANKINTKCQLSIIHIPNTLFTTSMTYSIISKKIEYGYALDALERRRSMDRVVIMDGSTHDFEKDSNCVLLAMALYKWDHSPERIKTKPYLLKGGYVDFVYTYPMYVSNPDIIMNNPQLSASPLAKQTVKLKDLYDFDQENNTEEERKKINDQNNQMSKSPTVNGFIGPMNNNFLINNQSNNTINSFEFINKINKVPGIAKQVQPTIPDRSSKPKIDFSLHNNLKNDNDSKSDMSVPSNILNGLNSEISQNQKSITNPNELRERFPKPEHLINGHNQTDNDLNGYVKFDKLTDNGDKSMDISDEDDLVAGNFDDLNHDNREPPPPSVPQTPVHRPNEYKLPLDDDMSEDEVESEERSSMTRSKPISMNRSNGTAYNYSAPSSLSRSLSSPNIAQFDQESHKFSFNSVGTGTPKFSQPLPQIDRSVKPLPYQALLRKPRDFNPQFSSCARITGLRNLGNTCFMNSILQCLNNTTELSEYFRLGKIHINPNSKFGSNGELTIELMELFKQMVYPSNYKHISPKDLKSAVIKHIPDFVEYKQQDAHEFLVRLLDRVHADINKCANVQVNDPVTKDPNFYDKMSIPVAANRFWNLHIERNKSIVTDLFEGLIVSSLTCQHCNYISKALEPFTCLTLLIQEGGRTSIGTSLKMFLKREKIEAAWQCPTCNQKRNAEKNTYIWRLPKILVIHLKRFSYDGMWRQKISTFVDFPIDNLLIEARDGELNRSYNLYGVVNHTGSLEGGHYIAYSRNLDHDIGWNKYDDQDVNPVPPSEVITQNAYVLFYKQAKTSSV